VLSTLLLLDLESHPPHAGIDRVTIEVDPAPGRIVQFSLLERPTPSAETVATLNARLGALLGDDRCGSPVLLDSHRPDAMEMTRFNPDPRGRPAACPERALPVTRVEGACPERALPDTRVEGACPERALPDTRVEVVVLRRFRPPIAIRVALERGRPAHIPVDRKGMPGGRVQQSAGPWRTSGAWWTDGTAWDRDEWDVALADGSVCRIFRE
jgi:protein ImuB